MNKQQLIKEAMEARAYSYTPYSKFPVGAALELEDGSIVRGANIENASYGLTNCAERTALFKAVSDGKRGVKRIAIVADTDAPVSPCGACRQVMAELCHPYTTVILTNLKGDIEETTVADLLPGAFKAEDMNE
ncbi:cytidine deaminase [Halalkalibacter hemicellulosilyticus]|uniref:Cytidine deaminase n=1 Tax=Halalkalibacter hemicellulosilyticusJCM 9152 TaxID=1236971 RepID=W4QG97_9BACI|nr:cytidine deaminase [Halalkalibacter hemicellulosilyticus]GAE30678.1 cytidine deaminase [Halalkalibacter hemicellulosilyticusJCM 9152]